MSIDSLLPPQHFVLTLDGTVQNLGTLLSAVYGSLDNEPSLRECWLQPRGANGNPIYVGGSGEGTLSSTNFGFRLEAGTAGVPPAPFSFGDLQQRQLRLSQINVLGTNGQHLHVFIVPALV